MAQSLYLRVSLLLLTTSLLGCAKQIATEPTINGRPTVRAQFVTGNVFAPEIRLQVANDSDSQRRGLMFIDNLPENEGMLFVWTTDDERSFWMKDTYVPLDIIFLDKNWQIISIGANAKPGSEERTTSTPSCRYAVEVNAGYAKKFSLGPGSRLKLLTPLLPGGH